MPSNVPTVVSTSGIDKATWTLFYEAGRPTRQLPWAVMQFGDLGAEGDGYVVPLPPSASIQSDMPAVALPAGIAAISGRIQPPEYMPFSPFPFEGARPARGNSKEDTDVAGPIGIHFFGGI